MSKDNKKNCDRRFELIFNNCSDAIFIHDLKGKFLEVNKTACKRLGYTKKELLKIGPRDIDAPEFSSEVTAKIKELKKNGEAIFETAHVTKKNARIPVELSSKVIDYEGKKAIISFARDISERKDEEEKYRELFDNMKSGVAVYEVKNSGNKFYFTNFNKEAERIEGFKRENVVGKEIRELFPGALDMGIVKVFKQVYKTGKSVYFPEAKIVDKKGRINYRSNFIYRVKDNYIIAIFDDITEKVKEKRELEETELKLEKIIDFVPSAIFTIDKDKNIVTWNKEAENITGYKADEIIGKKCSDFAVWPCLEKCGLYSKDIKKPIKNKECTIRNKKGEIVWISKNVDYLRDVLGNVVGGIESFVNITKEREKEEILNEKAEENEKIIKLLTGREVRMIELKEEVESLKKIIKDKDLEKI